MTNRRYRLKAYGRFDTGLVDAQPVREHMMMLAEFGLGYKRVAKLAGIGITPARNLIWGRQDSGPRYGELQKQVKRETAEAILAVKPEIGVLAGGARIPARGVHRRVQALVTMGWSQSKLADRLGMERGNFGLMMQRTHVTVRVHREVAALFEELWNVLPPREEWHDKIAFARSKGYARKRRWLPPLAWDDIDNDVEPPVPDEIDGVDEVLVHLAVSGDHVRLSPAERRAAVTVLHDARLSDSAIAERLHCADRTVLRIRQELGLAAAVGADGQAVA
jgi:transposase